MTAPLPWPELMAPFPVAPAFGEPAAATVQQPALADLFASLLERCLDTAPVRQPGDPRPQDDILHPAAIMASLVPVEAEEASVPPTPVPEPSVRLAPVEIEAAEQEEVEAPPIEWGGPIVPAPPPQVEIPLSDAPETLEEGPQPARVTPASTPTRSAPAEPATETGPAPERPTREKIAVVPPPVAPSTPAVVEPVRALPQPAALIPAPSPVRAQPPRAARPSGELAFAARLTDRSPEQSRRQLLAVLAAPESEVRLTETSFGARPHAVRSGPDHSLPAVAQMHPSKALPSVRPEAPDHSLPVVARLHPPVLASTYRAASVSERSQGHQIHTPVERVAVQSPAPGETNPERSASATAREQCRQDHSLPVVARLNLPMLGSTSRAASVSERFQVPQIQTPVERVAVQSPTPAETTTDRSASATAREHYRQDHSLPVVARMPMPTLEGTSRAASVSDRSQCPPINTPEGDGPGPRRPEAAQPAKPDTEEQPARKVEARTFVLPARARSAATEKPQGLLESPAEPRAFPRPIAPVGPPAVFADHRATPLAPYRAPEFVATQPGVRMPWSTPADLPVNPTESRPKPVHEFSLVVPPRAGENREHGQVQVRVVERAGEIKVAVHTPDTELAQSLREQLGDLVQRLERTGYHTETWQPGEAHQAGLRRPDPCGEYDPAGGRHSDHQGSQHHQSRQHRQQQDRPRWFETLEVAGLGDASSRPDSRSTHDLSH